MLRIALFSLTIQRFCENLLLDITEGASPFRTDSRKHKYLVGNAACPVPAKPSFRRERGLSRSGEAIIS